MQKELPRMCFRVNTELQWSSMETAHEKIRGGGFWDSAQPWRKTTRIKGDEGAWLQSIEDSRLNRWWRHRRVCLIRHCLHTESFRALQVKLWVSWHGEQKQELQSVCRQFTLRDVPDIKINERERTKAIKGILRDRNNGSKWASTSTNMKTEEQWPLRL